MQAALLWIQKINLILWLCNDLFLDFFHYKHMLFSLKVKMTFFFFFLAYAKFQKVAFWLQV